LVPLDDPFLAEVEAARTGWAWAGFDEQVPGPEAWTVHEEAGRSLLLARDAAGELRAFVNACTHRGTRLCRGRGRGRVRCPYHGWVFACDGRLLGATRRAGLAPADDRDLALRRWGCAAVGPLVFVHPSAEPPDLGEQLGEEAERVRRLTAGREGAGVSLAVDLQVAWGPAKGGLEASSLPGLGDDPATAWIAPNLRVDAGAGRVAVVAALPWTAGETRLRGRAWGPGAAAWAASLRRALSDLPGNGPPSAP
jgi:nitrite reductase/ring-hydroxylating ferredoxin subunit